MHLMGWRQAPITGGVQRDFFQNVFETVVSNGADFIANPGLWRKFSQQADPDILPPLAGMAGRLAFPLVGSAPLEPES